MRILLTLTLVMLTASAVIAGPARTPTPAMKPAATPNPTAAALSRLSGNEFAIAFIRELLPINQETIEIVNAATLYADHPVLLQWNQRVIDRKSAQDDLILSTLRQLNVSPGRQMAMVVSPSVKQMRSLRGAALEKAYIPLMITMLGRSLDLETLAVAKAVQPGLHLIAQDAVKADNQDIVMLRGWMATWYPK